MTNIVVVIGNPLIDLHHLLAKDEKEWNEMDKSNIVYTNERNLAKILSENKIMSSISEVKRNKPELCVKLDKPDFITLKIGKKFVTLVVGV